MPTNFTPLSNGQAANAANLNAPLSELDQEIEDIKSGTSVMASPSMTTPALGTPTITSLVSMQHDHSNAANGGAISMAAIDTTGQPAGTVFVADGSGLLIPAPALGKDSVFRNGQLSTTSLTWTDVNAAFNLTIDTNGGDVLIGFSGMFYHANGYTYFDVDVDGVRIGSTNEGLGAGYAAQIAATPFTILKSGLSAGSHTFKLQWRVNGPTGYLLGSTPISCEQHFFVRELRD